MVTVLDLQSGGPQLVIDTDIEVSGLGMTGSVIIVFGKDEVNTWSLIAGEAGVKFNIIVQKKTLDFSPPSRFVHPYIFSSVSPDLSRIVTSGFSDGDSSAGLDVYDASTGGWFAGVTSSTGVLKSLSLLVNSRSLI